MGVGRMWAGAAVLVALSIALCLALIAQVEANGYYEPFTHGYVIQLAHGHAALNVEPSAALTKLPDPYDPTASPEVPRFFDASYYHGHYYAYFGVAPFATFLVPLYWISGRALSGPASCCLYVAAMEGLLALILCQLRRRWYPGASVGITWAAVAIALFANPALLLLRRPEIYELEIAAGSFHLLLSVLFLLLALERGRRSLLWIAAAALSLGIAVGCRPQCVVITPFFLAWTAWAFPEKRRQALIAAFVPLAFAGTALAAFNYARFDNPFEFGFSYQLVDYTRRTVGFLSLRNLPYNAWLYAFGPAQLSRYFPYFFGEAESPVPMPAAHEATDRVYGLLLFVPILWVGLVGLPALWRGGPRARLHALVIGMAALSFSPFLLMGNGAYRYAADFGPLALLCAALGLLALPPCLGIARLARGAGIAVLAVASVVSILAQQYAAGYGQMAEEHPERLDRVAPYVNAPVYLIERLFHIRPKVPALDVRFPTDRNGSDEPLLVVGPPALQDFIYVYYASPSSVRIGCESDGRGGLLSDEIPVDYAKVHTLRFYLGSLYPPAGHPLLAGLSPEQLAHVRNRIVVTLDDGVVLDGPFAFHRVTIPVVRGASPDDAAFGRRFTGQIVQNGFAHLPVDPAWGASDPAAYGPRRLRIDLASIPIDRTGQPLLCVGYAPWAGLVSVRRVDAHHYRFSYRDHAGQTEGAAMNLEPSRLHVLEIDLGSLRPPLGSPLWAGASPTDQATLQNRVRVLVDGQPAIETSNGLGAVSPNSVMVGRNGPCFWGIAKVYAEGKLIELGRQDTEWQAP